MQYKILKNETSKFINNNYEYDIRFQYNRSDNRNIY